MGQHHPPISHPPSPPDGLSSAQNRLPRMFTDELPSAPGPVYPIPQPIRRVILHIKEYFRTGLNAFGVVREYVYRRPSYDPDAHLPSDAHADFQTDLLLPNNLEDANHPPPPWPFTNMSKYLFMNWYHSGSHQKSEAEATRLVKEVICAPGFQPEHLRGFNVHQENQRMDDAMAKAAPAPSSTDDWREASVDIEVPIPVRSNSPPVFRIPGLHYRSIIQVIKSTWATPIASQFHLAPFRKIHVDPAGVEHRIFDEVYTSEAWEDEHNRLQKQPQEPGCKLEKVIAGLMLWSDSTRLANFGTASAWPLYLYFANLSKYTRAKPNSGACHHIAYIPSVGSRLHSGIYC